MEHYSLKLVDLDLHARIQEFLPVGGGGGVEARLPENSSGNVFLVTALFSVSS